MSHDKNPKSAEHQLGIGSDAEAGSAEHQLGTSNDAKTGSAEHQLGMKQCHDAELVFGAPGHGTPKHDDLRNVFANPWVWLVTHGVFPLLTVVSTVFCAWLLWDELDKDGITASVVAVAVPALIVGLSLCAALVYRRRQIPLWMSIASTVTGVAYLFGYLVCADMRIPPGTPDWMVSASHGLLVFAGMMPLVLTGIWRVATVPLPLSPKKDKIITLASTVGVPIVSFMFLQTLFVTSFVFDSVSGKIIGYFLGITLCAIVPILFFLALFRAMMWIRLWGRERAVVGSTFFITLFVAIILPIAGLLLNGAIPFPADFQSPWVYVLTLVNGAVLLLKSSNGFQPLAKGHPQRLEAVATFLFFLRWLTFPFTLYFFLIFIPFFPLAILAMIAVGLGFLILAPVLLFWNHVTLLARDWRTVALSRVKKTLLAILAVAVMPGAILTNAYLDRAAFRTLLDYAFSPDITQDATLPVSPARARRILERAEAFKHQNETPILSAVYTQIVFDGLVLPDDRFNFMWDCYVGERDEKTADRLLGNIFGSLFARNNARAERGWGRRVPPPRDAALESGDVQVAVSTNAYEQTVRHPPPPHHVA